MWLRMTSDHTCYFKTPITHWTFWLCWMKCVSKASRDITITMLQFTACLSHAWHWTEHSIHIITFFNFPNNRLRLWEVTVFCLWSLGWYMTQPKLDFRFAWIQRPDPELLAVNEGDSTEGILKTWEESLMDYVYPYLAVFHIWGT